MTADDRFIFIALLLLSAVSVAVLYFSLITLVRRSEFRRLPGSFRRQQSRILAMVKSITKIHRHDVPYALIKIVLGLGIYVIGATGALLVLAAKAAADLPGFDRLAKGSLVWATRHGGAEFRAAGLYLGRRAHDVILFGPRPPIVLLRSFQDESLLLAGEIGSRRLEEVIVSAMKPFGPIVAIARPNALLEVGAEREYIADDRWRNEIALWIERSAIIVVEIGKTTGLLWELRHIIETSAASKLVLVFPEIDRASRTATLREIFANTRWEPQLTPDQLGKSCLAVSLMADASFVISSQTSRVLDYTVAVQIRSSGSPNRVAIMTSVVALRYELP